MIPHGMQNDMMDTMHRFHRFNRTVVFNNITRAEFRLLEILTKERQAPQQGLHVSELAEQLEVSPPGVSRMLRRMEGQGWLERRTNPDDRRNTLVMATPMGEQVLADAAIMVERFAKNVSEQLGKEDTEALIRLWNRLLDTMETEWKTIQNQDKENTR